MMRRLLIAAVVAGIAAAAPFDSGAADARSRHDAAAHQDGGGRPVIRFGEPAGERPTDVANVPRFTRFVHPGWAERQPRDRHARWPHRRPVGLPVTVLGWFLSALSR
jgi:hypothetical protein